MHLDTAIGRPRSGPAGPSRAVRRIEPSPDVTALSSLERVDYADAFVVATGPPAVRTGEEWARLMLEDHPAAVRAVILFGWTSLGFRIGSTRDPARVLGWEVRRSTPDHALLYAGSRIGMPSDILFMRWHDSLLFATFVQHESGVARALWPRVGPLHRQVVRTLLQQVSRRSLAERSAR